MSRGGRAGEEANLEMGLGGGLLGIEGGVSEEE